MSEKTWKVDVNVHTIVRRTLTLTIKAQWPTTAEAEARAAVRQLEHDELPDGYRVIQWKVDDATATEVPS